MSHDTTEINRNRQNLAGRESVWVFGYGSLVYKAGFEFLQRRPARIRGWQRRFWQGSHDHRGTPEAPGRVLTLIPVEGAQCAGMAYRVTPQTLAPLDVREKNGYLRFETALEFEDGTQAPGLVYIAEPDNAAWLGPADEREIARHIAGASGPSGPNRDYLLDLAEALRALNEDDPHVFAIERELRSMEDQT